MEQNKCTFHFYFSPFLPPPPPPLSTFEFAFACMKLQTQFIIINIIILIIIAWIKLDWLFGLNRLNLITGNMHGKKSLCENHIVIISFYHHSKCTFTFFNDAQKYNTFHFIYTIIITLLEQTPTNCPRRKVDDLRIFNSFVCKQSLTESTLPIHSILFSKVADMPILLLLLIEHAYLCILSKITTLKFSKMSEIWAMLFLRLSVINFF